MAETRLNLTQIVTLREFVRRGTLAAAAEHLGYTAGAVSHHISSLEDAVGVPLVQRSGRQLVLTDAGRVLAGFAGQLLSLEAEAVALTRSSVGTAAGPLLVGTWGSAAVGLLAPIIKRMASGYPEVAITSREVDLDEVTSAVRHGDVDIAFGLDYVDSLLPRDAGISFAELHRETFVVAIAATSWPAGDGCGPQRREVSTEELAELDWILAPESSHYGRAVRAGLRRQGFEPRVVHEVTDTAASLQLAAAGLGATVMTDLMRLFNPTLNLASLGLPHPLTRQIMLLSRAGAAPREPVRVFGEVARELVTELLSASLPEGQASARRTGKDDDAEGEAAARSATDDAAQ